jgi:plasmid maintenance system antidote protein VapI
LQVGDIERFPCKDLKIIDKLWVHYSGGKFGFSVQKKIWQECGSPTEYNEDWKRFCERVNWEDWAGWKEYSEMYSELTQSLSHASLPYSKKFLKIGWFNWGLNWCTLLSRKDLPPVTNKSSIQTTPGGNQTPSKIDQLDLSSERPGINYRKLRDLLAAKRWVDADKETADRMCEVMGRTKQGWLRRVDIERFPCKDLKIIDKLWVHYSGGKFGFSVQKKIWQECGSPKRYNKNWQRFGERVGWKEKGEGWKRYREIVTQSLSHASLPVVEDAYTRYKRWFTPDWEVGVGTLGTHGQYTLLSRKDLPPVTNKSSIQTTPGGNQTPSKIDQLDLSSERVGINYRKLRDLLAAKRWVDADQETADRMCEVMGRTEQGWLQVGDIERFPCKDLKIIDKLWVHYSGGKFGFSVQKKIWQECGSPTGTGWDYRLWKRFGERVGWKEKGGNWKKYSELTQSLSHASLPVAGVVGDIWGGYYGVWWMWCGWYSSLAQRLVNCSK